MSEHDDPVPFPHKPEAPNIQGCPECEMVKCICSKPEVPPEPLAGTFDSIAARNYRHNEFGSQRSRPEAPSEFGPITLTDSDLDKLHKPEPPPAQAPEWRPSPFGLGAGSERESPQEKPMLDWISKERKDWQAAYERLERELAELRGLDRWNNSHAINKIKVERDQARAEFADMTVNNTEERNALCREFNKALTQERAKSQALVEALTEIADAQLYPGGEPMSDPDALDTVEMIAREALKQFGGGE